MRLGKGDHRGDGRSLRDALVRLSARGVSAKPPDRKQNALSWSAFLVYNTSAMKTKTKTTRKRVYPILQQIVNVIDSTTIQLVLTAGFKAGDILLADRGRDVA